MWNRIALLSLCIFSLAACDRAHDDSHPGSPTAACTEQSPVSPQLQQTETGALIPGVYEFAAGDYVYHYGGDDVTVIQTYGPDAQGRTVHSARVICPVEGKLSHTVPLHGSMSFDNSVSSTLVVNGNGEIEIPDYFTLLGISATFSEDHVGVDLVPTKSSSLLLERVRKDTFRNIPGIKIVRVKDGFVVILTGDDQTDSRTFFRLVKATASARPAPVAPVPVQPKIFSKAECLQKKQIILGKYPQTLVGFNTRRS